MNNVIVIFLGIVFCSQIGMADSVIPEQKIPPNEGIIKVSGLVCSFCAVCVQEKVKGLSFLNKAKYSGGVKVEIDRQRLLISLNPNQQLNIDKLYAAIKSGGYEPIQSFIADKNGDISVYNAKGTKCTQPTC